MIYYFRLCIKSKHCPCKYIKHCYTSKLTAHVYPHVSKHVYRHVMPYIWAASSEFGTYRLCEQRRFIRAVSPEPPLLAHTSSESRGTFRQKARSLAPLNGWACAVKICHDGMLEDTNWLDAVHMVLPLNVSFPYSKLFWDMISCLFSNFRFFAAHSMTFQD